MKKLQVKLFHSNNGIESLANEINTFLEENNLMTEDFIDIKFSMAVGESSSSKHHHHYCVVVIYRKQL